MNGKTAKLIRKVAKTNPYGVKDIMAPTKYGRSKNSAGTQVLAPGLRLTTKFIKKFYKQRFVTASDLRTELEAASSLN